MTNLAITIGERVNESGEIVRSYVETFELWGEQHANIIVERGIDILYAGVDSMGKAAAIYLQS